MTGAPSRHGAPGRAALGGSAPLIAALGVTQIVGYGSLYYAFPVLVPGIAAEFGVAEAVLYGAFSAGLLLGGLTAPVLGRWMDRIGAATVMAAGSAAMAVLVALMALAPSVAAFAALVIVVEVLGFAVLYDAAFAALAAKVPGATRRAITHLTLIAGFASTLFWPLTGWLADEVGWRGGYAAFAALHLAVALPLHLWIARRPACPEAAAAPAGPGERPATRLGGAAARRAFWQVGIGFALSGMAISALGVHMVPVLLARGLGDAAYLVAMTMGPAQVAIRVIDATLWRRLHPVAVAIVSAAALTLAAAMLLIPGPGLVPALLFAAVFGIGGGLSSIVRGAVPVALFGAEGLGLRLGQLAALRNVLGAAAPFLFALTAAGLGTDAALILTIALAGAGWAVTAWLWRDVGRAHAGAPAMTARPDGP